MEQVIPKKLGRFVIAEKLGDGRNGEVYRCWDPEHHKDMAVKRVKADISSRLSFRARGLAAISNISKVTDSRVCQIYETIESDDGYLLVSEFIDGRKITLPSVEPALLNNRFLCMAINLAKALETIHKRKLVHGNIKLSNYMIDHEEQLKILDYGIPVDFDIEQLEEEGKPYNWIQYLSPEMLNGEGPSRQSDIYALGVVFYQLCCGRLPFEAETNRKLISAIISTPPDMEPLRSTGLHGDSLLLIGKMLSKSHIDRFADATELLITIEEMALYSNEKHSPIIEPEPHLSPRTYLSISVLVLVIIIFWIILASLTK